VVWPGRVFRRGRKENPRPAGGRPCLDRPLPRPGKPIKCGQIHVNQMKNYYITTPLYYVNDVPHIGHAYTTIAADVLARWKRLQGTPVFFLTGTDEHGAKIAQAAQAKGETPQAYADRIVETFKVLWKRLLITYDDFIRTTEPRHLKLVDSVFEALKKGDDIYKGIYEDWYCTPCESFLSESDLAEGKCPTCGRPVERLREESYFFRLSKYEKPLLAHFGKHPEFLQPSSRSKEILNFVKAGLRDLSVSRTKVKWGVPVSSDPGHTVYVWFDALLNYITAPGYGRHKGSAGESRAFEDVWPADVHFVGKEIFRFHTVIWPAMLMALKLPLPRRVFAHGWWTTEGEKMSKSKGNFVNPHDIIDDFSVDTLRYFMLREVPFGGDGDFSRKSLLGRYNGELANALGNLLNRTLNLVEKHFEDVIPPCGADHGVLPKQEGKGWIKTFDEAMERLAFHEALQQVQSLVGACNKYMDEKAPWSAVKTDKPAAGQTLHDVLRVLKLLTVVLHPFMPTATQEMWKQLGEKKDLSKAGKDILKTAVCEFSKGQKVKKGAPLFPRR